jgi:PAS domain S-box-containing protein
MIDVTEQKEAEALLVAMNETLEHRVAERTAERDRAWRNTQDVLITLEPSGLLEAVNPAWTALLGFEASETLGRSFRDFIHPEDAAVTVAAFSQSGDVLESYQNRYRHKDGSRRWISWRAAREGDHIYASGRDVTREREAAEDLARTQEALRQSQKMEAMGQLTGGVAHDFNNLLSPIIGSLDLLQRRTDTDARMKRLIEGALTSAERAKTLVQRLLAFARRQPLQTTAVDIADLVDGMSGLLATTLGPGLRLDVHLEQDLPAAQADANQLEMALLNLAVNARDAMPSGGTLTVGAAAGNLDEGNEKNLVPGRYVRLWVADTGIGMDEATLARSVEPFFSTKGLGRGTGLGLSMVHGLTAQLGGCLEMQSKPGSGTSITLWLPCAEEAAALAPVASQSAQPIPANGRILLVDDDDLVRSSTSEMLVDLGYEVVQAETAGKALKTLHAGFAPDIVVTDHLMPGMTGVELARLLGERRPRLPVLIVSGYAEVDGIASDLKRLAKPFRQADLAAALEEVRMEKRSRRRSDNLLSGRPDLVPE